MGVLANVMQWNLCFAVVTFLTFNRFDAESKHVFVGDYAGHINVIKLESNSLAVVTNLKGHTGKFWSSWFGEGDCHHVSVHTM